MAAGATTLLEKAEAPQTRKKLQTENLSLDEQARRRAHEIWLGRDGRARSDVTDWLEAEREIISGGQRALGDPALK